MGCCAFWRANSIVPVVDTGRRKDMTVASKDDKNLKQVLDKIEGMDEPARGVMRRMHDVIVAAAPELKPRIWYGMPGLQSRRVVPSSSSSGMTS